MELDSIPWRLKNLCPQLRSGITVREAAEANGLDVEAVVDRLGELIGVERETVERILCYSERGWGLEYISCETGVDMRKLRVFLPEPSIPDWERLRLIALASMNLSIDDIALAVSLQPERVQSFLQSCSQDGDASKYERILATIVCKKLSTGLNLLGICTALSTEPEDLKATIAKELGLDLTILDNVFDMKSKRLSLQEICDSLHIKLETLQLFLPDVGAIRGDPGFPLGATPAHLILETASTLNQREVASEFADSRGRKGLNPRRDFMFSSLTGKFYRQNCLTGAEYAFKLPNLQLRRGCSVCEGTGEKLFIAGGESFVIRMKEVSQLDVSRDYAQILLPQMSLARKQFSFLHYAGYLYALGGLNYEYMADSERYSFDSGKWESLAPLPLACADGSAIQSSNCIFVVGGRFDEAVNLEFIQKLSLNSLTWEILSLQLPVGTYDIPCFKVSETDSPFFILIENKVYLFNPDSFTLQPLLTLPRRLRDYKMPCKYRGGTLYCSSYHHKTVSFPISF